MPSGVYKRTKSPWNVGIPRSQKVKDRISKAHKGKSAGSKNPNWRGGIYTNIYIFLHKPNHPLADYRGYVKRANLVMEKHLERYLTKQEVIHHKGVRYPVSSTQNKQDDRIENFQLFPNEIEHQKFHNSKRVRNKLGQFIS